MSAYTLVIAASVIVIISYFYNLIAKRFNVPSVLLLIITGIIIKQAMNYFDVGRIDWFPYLEILGIVGLIMIVLEAALDLKLEREKMPLIGKSLLIALLGLVVSSAVAAFIIMLILPDFSWLTAHDLRSAVIHIKQCHYYSICWQSSSEKEGILHL